MDSLNVHKGYDKVVDHDQPPPPPTHAPPRNRLRPIAISLTVILTVVICSLIIALVHETITEPPEQDLYSITAVCSVTPYPASCSAALSNHSLSEPDPERILSLSLRVAVSELRNLTSLPKALILKANDKGTESALADCEDLFGDALVRLSESARAAEDGVKGGVAADLNTWISAAMSDQETCVDGLEEMGSTVVDEVRARAQRSKEYMSNSLAILANMNALLEKFH